MVVEAPVAFLLLLRSSMRSPLPLAPLTRDMPRPLAWDRPDALKEFAPDRFRGSADSSMPLDFLRKEDSRRTMSQMMCAAMLCVGL